MRHSLRATLLAGLLLLLVVESARAGLREDVELLIRTANLRGATVAVSIVDVDSGATLVNIDSDRPMIPASNMKLLTTGAALHTLGPTFMFTTRLLQDGDRLIILGDGDPAFADPDLLLTMQVGGLPALDVESFLDLWIRPVLALDLDRVREIVVDDRIFDREFVHDMWPRDQLNRRYCAEVAGFNFHQNVLHVYPRPILGERPSIAQRLPHADWIDFINNATSETGLDADNTIWIARQLEANVFTVRGNARFAYRAPVPVTMHDVPEFAAHLLADRLKRAGLEVDGFRVSAENDRPSTGRIVGPVITSPIATVVTRCNTNSQNLYAEALLKRMAHAVTGRPGSWLSGAAVLRNVINERLGDDGPSLIARLYISDGSGMSRENLVTAELLTSWLHSFANDERVGPLFVESLAEAGATGTLRTRFSGVDLHGTRVLAKSGFINEVSCLSGYVAHPDGRRCAFSVLVNDLKAPTRRAKSLQERIVEQVAADLATAPAVSLGSD